MRELGNLAGFVIWALGVGDAPVCEMALSGTLMCTFPYV